MSAASALAAILNLAIAPLPANAACNPAPTGGSDVITCDAADDTVNALGGNDSVSGGGGNDVINGGAGADQLYGGSGDDTLQGAGGADALYGEAGNDSLVGGAGNDTYYFDTDTPLGADTLTEASGGGTETLQFGGSNDAISVDLGLVGDQVVNGNLTLNLTAAQVERATGGTGDDLLTGNGLANLLRGGAGTDALNGGAGNDTLYGDAGNDTLAGDAGNDTLYGGAGDDTLIGGDGNDTLRGEGNNDTYQFDADTALGADQLIDSGGTDTIDFSPTVAGVTVNLGVTGNQIVNTNLTMSLSSATAFENLVGGSGDDTVFGTSGTNQIFGGDGDDALDGGAGNDTLWGDAGDDTLAGGLGNDSLDGGDGTDNLLGGDGTDSLVGGDGNDTLDGGAGADTLDGGDGADDLSGGAANDTLDGGGGDDSLDGGDGNDSLSGGAGNDTLTTSAGVDSLDGDDGDDTFVIGGTHEAGDTISGGGGRNTFAFQFGTSGVLALIAGDDDVLDFSLFGSPVSIDLSSSSQQDVGGGLFLTLSGLFRRVIGTAFNDILTGNAADNTIQGGAGDDLISGGAGSDSLYGESGNDSLDGGADADLLDGGDGTDTALNYEAQDTHISIELGLPETGGGSDDSATGPHSALYRVDSGELVLLSCEAPRSILRLAGGDQVSFWNLCRYQASLSVPDESNPMFADLEGRVSAMDVGVFQDETSLILLPSGSRLDISFVLPDGVEADTFEVVYWDAQAENWVPLPWAPETGFRPTFLNPDDAGDSRQILAGVTLVEDNRLTTTVNFAGNFALVAR
jgi:Ca2+-binding RTX toxin-like protein